MTIKSHDVTCRKTASKVSTYSKSSYLSCNNLVKINYAAESNVSYAKNKLNKIIDFTSPYLSDSTQFVAPNAPEKLFQQKKHSRMSYEVNIHKANSDELKLLNNNKKVKKSVLTLPKQPDPQPQSCPVSDLNDSESCIKDDNNHNYHKKFKKRTIQPINSKKHQSLQKKPDFYGTDGVYCSQMDIDLDGSASDMIRNYNGDEKRKIKRKMISGVTEKQSDEPSAHDVWAVLRNINRFQFDPSPPASENEFKPPKREKFCKRRKNKRNLRVIETCRTEKYAYTISNIEVDRDSQFSISSSYDRITVIEKQDNIDNTSNDDQSLIGMNFVENQNSNILNQLKTAKTVSPQRRRNSKAYINSKKKGDFCASIKCIDPEVTGNETEQRDVSANKINETEKLPNKNSLNIKIPRLLKECSSQCDNTCAEQTCDVVKEIEDYKPKGKTGKPKCNNPQQHKKQTKPDISKKNNVPQVIKNKLRKKPTCLSMSKIPEAKLGQTANGKKIGNISFPIVILDKNELSSSFEVVEPPSQFQGLEEKVWPFMFNWDPENPLSSPFKWTFNSKLHFDNKKNNSKEKMPTLTKLRHIDKLAQPKQKYEIKQVDTNRIDKKRVPPPPHLVVKNTSEQGIRNKPMKQLKNRMLNFLYKNTSTINGVDDITLKKTQETEQSKIKDDKCFNGTATKMTLETSNAVKKTVTSKPNYVEPVTSTGRRPWARAKWASDFIENVIKKIKNGAYYTKDLKQDISQESKQAEIQVTASNVDTVNEVAVEENLETVIIPGFNNSLPALEITTLNMTEIAVKNCAIDVLVHFDLTMPKAPLITSKKSTSFIPINETVDHAKAFKCDSSIVNAMLPAEICTILPKIFNNFIKWGEQFRVPQEQAEAFTLIPISELPQYRRDVFFNVAPSVKKILNGRYDKTPTVLNEFNKISPRIEPAAMKPAELMTPLSKKFWFNNVVMPIPAMIQNIEMLPKSSIQKTRNNCMALQLYRKPEFPCNSFTIIYDLEKMLRVINMNNTHFAGEITSILQNNSMTVKSVMKTLPVNNELADSLKWSILGNRISSYLLNTNIFSSRCIENRQRGSLTAFPLNDLRPKNEMKCCVKQPRKCKSAINMSEDKTITPLNKIIKLEDFLQIIGSSGKVLASIFDAQRERKILSCVREMMRWSTNINSKQALLLLLLANKKDTRNLIRFRTVLVQGIALNRITRANELDMEIEVIEREQLKETTQNKDISDVPEYVENQDSLYEELCWIAKTTASDHQRPFKESSEKLLRNLLEKQKKLNPSYLRVMARYVGLGLLKKSPSSK